MSMLQSWQGTSGRFPEGDFDSTTSSKCCERCFRGGGNRRKGGMDAALLCYGGYSVNNGRKT